MQARTTLLPRVDNSSRSQAVSWTPGAVAPNIKPTDFTLLHASPIFSETFLIDLSHSPRVLHSIESGPCSSSSDIQCNCIHYGYSAPLSDETFITKQLRDLPRQKLDEAGKIPHIITSNPLSHDSSITNSSSGDLSSCLGLSTAYDLIANEDKSYDLQHLLAKFISKEKMKQQTLIKQQNTNSKQSVNPRPVNNRLSQSLGSLNTFPGRQPSSASYSPSDLYIRGRSSHSHQLRQPVINKQPVRNDQNECQNRYQTMPLILSRDSTIKLNSHPAEPRLAGDSAPGNRLPHDNNVSGDEAKGLGSPGIPKDRQISPQEKQSIKLIFGLSDKSNKGKYLQLANNRKVSSSDGREASQHSSAPQPEKKVRKAAPDSPKVLSKSGSVGSAVDERFADQLMQLTDDEKVQFILASHTKQQSDGRSNILSPNADQQLLMQPQHQQQEAKAKLKETSKQNFLQPKATPTTNLSKYRSLSCDSLNGNKQLIDFQSYRGPQMIDYSSPFDYAKTRFINSFVLSGVKGPDARRTTPSQNLVLETKNKLLEKTLVTPKQVCDSFDSKLGFRRNTINASVMKVPVRNPTKPYLSRGSVAERVLLFEKCPEIQAHRKSLASMNRRSKSPVLYRHWKMSPVERIATSDPSEKKETRNEQQARFRTLRRGFSKQGSSAGLEIPKFYFPTGRPYTSLDIERCMCKIRSEFEKLPGKCVIAKNDMSRITKACGLPLSWKEVVRQAVIASRQRQGRQILEPVTDVAKECKITCEDFLEYWRSLISSCFDEASRFVAILSKGQRNYLLPEDFVPMIQDVVECHPGLTFLKEAMEFHSRYVHTVIARIYYCVNRSWSGRLTAAELRKSNFLAVVALLDEEEDINQITEYFSYEHFYVIYCKFWELDKDHDLIIDKHDLSRHNDSAISVKMIDRIFSGAVTRGPVSKYGKMTYSEFVWFLISEEDKSHPRAIEYWFRCMDLDGDGFLSVYELEWFYTEQFRRLEAMGIEPLPFTDTLCQMLDMIRPEARDRISLSDLKKSKMTAVFFDTFFNLEKYLDHEQRDPFACSRNDDDISDWDRYAAEEYEVLVAEENTNPNQSTASTPKNSSSTPAAAPALAGETGGGGK